MVSYCYFVEIWLCAKCEQIWIKLTNDFEERWLQTDRSIFFFTGIGAKIWKASEKLKTQDFHVQIRKYKQHIATLGEQPRIAAKLKTVPRLHGWIRSGRWFFLFIKTGKKGENDKILFWYKNTHRNIFICSILNEVPGSCDVSVFNCHM